MRQMSYEVWKLTNCDPCFAEDRLRMPVSVQRMPSRQTAASIIDVWCFRCLGAEAVGPSSVSTVLYSTEATGGRPLRRFSAESGDNWYFKTTVSWQFWWWTIASPDAPSFCLHTQRHEFSLVDSKNVFFPTYCVTSPYKVILKRS